MRKKAKIGRQTTCYVIAYDIPDDKRRTKVHKILLGYGKWKEMVLLRSKLAEHLIDEKDSVRFYPICSQCLTRVETVGGPQPHEESVFII
jgi:CRISPR-associated protein Cas2